jgi:hypothetical protein
MKLARRLRGSVVEAFVPKAVANAIDAMTPPVESGAGHERLYNETAPYLLCLRPKSSTAANKSLRVKSGQSFDVTYISV